jgi:UDP-glucose 4-epimerase
MSTVIVTGGAGYIGSHTCVELHAAGYDVVVVDDLRNAQAESLRRIERISGRAVEFHRVDVADEPALARIFESRKDLAGVIHFAGLKSVGDSVAQPLEYFSVNLGSTLSLLRAMDRAGCRNLVFSSSSTVYDPDHKPPFGEDAPLRATNPYGATKLIIEDILRSVASVDPRWTLLLLRYFNPVGAHQSGLIGEDPSGIPANLVPYIAQVIVGRRPKLRVFGTDYPTPDGTAIRDFIHVVDLARGHVAALRKLGAVKGARAYTLGCGRGYSVLEVHAAMEKAAGQAIPYELAPRRAGDSATSFANPDRARDELGWTAQLGITGMCADAVRFQRQNPQGYPRD